MYSTMLCPYCRAAKSFLQEKGWDYEDIRVDLKPTLRQEMMEKSGRRTVPQIWINDHHIGGYTDMVELEQSGELEAIVADNS